MRYFYLTVFIIVSIQAFTQNNFPKKVLGSFVFEGQPYNYEFSSPATDNYSFKITKSIQLAAKAQKADSVRQQDSDSLSLESNEEIIELFSKSNTGINKPPQTEHDSSIFLFDEFEQEVFQSIFENQMIQKFGVDSTTALHDKAVAIFYKIKAKFEFIDDEPVTAFLLLKNEHLKSLLKSNTSVYYNGELSRVVARHRVERVKIEIAEGAIKNIIVHVVRPDVQLAETPPQKYAEFKNVYPISIASKFNPEYFATIRLYCINCYGIEGLNRFIVLSDLLSLDIQLENGKEDYSPAETVIELKPTSAIAELKKERRSQIVDVSAFTDFVGLDQEQPNGLVQIEAKRRLNLKTKSRQIFNFRNGKDIANQINLTGARVLHRGPIFKKEITYTMMTPKSLGPLPDLASLKAKKDTIVVYKGNKITYHQFDLTIPNRKFHSPYTTALNFIEPRLLFSKLEEHNRTIDSATISDEKILPLTLFQYQLVSFGASLSVLRISFPEAKFTWNMLSVGGYWFRSRIGVASDSVQASTPLNSSYWHVTSEFQFLPDSRWGINAGVNYFKPQLWNTNYELANAHGLLQPYFNAFIRTNDTNRLFFRFRWTFEHHNPDSNFTQVQLGYSMTLFKANNTQSTSPTNGN